MTSKNGSIDNEAFSFSLSLGMFRKLLTFLLLVLSWPSFAQELSGTWIMAYVKAKQPIYTMVEVDGQYELAEDIPQDSSYVFGTGLMVLEFLDNQKAVSYSWEGREDWTTQFDNDRIELFGGRDTLYGTFNKGQFVVSSTLDDRPTKYFFEELKTKAYQSPELVNTSFAAKVKGHYFNNNNFHFGTTEVQHGDGQKQNKDQYTWHSLTNLEVVEYELLWEMLGDMTYSEFGMMYLYQEGKQVKGVVYPITESTETPKRYEVRFKKSR